MEQNGKLLCLKEALIKPEVGAKFLLEAIYACSVHAEQVGLSKDNLDKAYNMIISLKQSLTKNAEGKRCFLGDDEVRESISRLLFGIPLKNLRRKEERILPINPVESAAFDTPVQETKRSMVQETKKQSVKSKQEISNPIYTVQYFDSPDERAFEGYVGNKDVVETVKRQIKGAIERGESLREMFVRGVSGCGKTEFGLRVARFIGKPFYYVSGSTLKTAKDVDVLYDTVENLSVVFIDEVQAAGEKAKARILTKQSKAEGENDKEITFIFATNLSGKIPSAFRNRCIEYKLQEYKLDELMQIIHQTAKENGVELAEGVAKYISERCHGIARYAVNYTHDMIVENAAAQRVVSLEQANEFFARRGIDSFGLYEEHRQYIIQLARLGQASAHSLASSLGENDVAEIEKSIEPLLLKHGLITINSRGRCLTEDGVLYSQSLNREV